MCCVGRPSAAHERKFIEVLATGRVDHTPSSRRRQLPVAQPTGRQVGGILEEVGLEEDAVEGHPQPGERLALAGDHPGARLEPELERLRVALEDPLQQLVGGSSCSSSSRVSESSGCSSRSGLPAARRLHVAPRSRHPTKWSLFWSPSGHDCASRPLFTTPAIASPMLRPASEMSAAALDPASRLGRAPPRARCRSRDCAGARCAAPWSRWRPRTEPNSACRARGPTAAPRRCRRPRAPRRRSRSSRRRGAA